MSWNIYTNLNFLISRFLKVYKYALTLIIFWEYCRPEFSENLNSSELTNRDTGQKGEDT